MWGDLTAAKSDPFNPLMVTVNLNAILKTIALFVFLFTRAQGTPCYYAQGPQFAKTTNCV